MVWFIDLRLLQACEMTAAACFEFSLHACLHTTQSPHHWLTGQTLGRRRNNKLMHGSSVHVARGGLHAVAQRSGHREMANACRSSACFALLDISAHDEQNN